MSVVKLTSRLQVQHHNNYTMALCNCKTLCKTNPICSTND